MSILREEDAKLSRSEGQRGRPFHHSKKTNIASWVVRLRHCYQGGKRGPQNCLPARQNELDIDVLPMDLKGRLVERLGPIPLNERVHLVAR